MKLSTASNRYFPTSRLLGAAVLAFVAVSSVVNGPTRPRSVVADAFIPVVVPTQRAATTTTKTILHAEENDGNSCGSDNVSTFGAAASTKQLSTRRQALLGGVAAAMLGMVTLSPSGPAVADDGVGTCPRGSQNCIRTTWTPPANTSPSQASKTVKQVVEAYPQEGYDGVDLGGWKIVDDQFDNVGQVSRVEYTSGIGNFAKFLNGGKPFVDDLRIQVDPSTGVVQVKSNSRVGDSDLGVNKKRLNFFYKALSEKGWDVPEPTY